MSDRLHIRKRPFLAAALLSLQLVLAAVVPIADAAFDVAGDHPAQLDSHSGDPRPQGHDHRDCEFCRFAGQNLVSTATVNVAAAPLAWIRLPARAEPVLSGSALAYAPFAPRGPPLV